MLKTCITHKEATIRSFIRNTDYAEYYLHTVLADGESLTDNISNLGDKAMSDTAYEELSTTQ